MSETGRNLSCYRQQQKLTLETQAQLHLHLQTHYSSILCSHSQAQLHIRTPQVLTLSHYSSGPVYILPRYQPVYLPKYHPRCLSIEPFTKGLIPKVTHYIHVYLLVVYDTWIISLGPLMDQTNSRQPPSSLYRI